uniref:Gsp_12 putative toxin n=1 Tax=Gemmula speciosa TaxID=439592 RepID=A0A098LWC9_GEMSP
MNVKATLTIFVLAIMAADFVSPASLRGGDVQAIDYDVDTRWGGPNDELRCISNCLDTGETTANCSRRCGSG